ALDLSPRMLAAARARCAAHPHVELCLADALTLPLEPEAFDVVATVATLHHLPLAALPQRVRRARRPGRVFGALDGPLRPTPPGPLQSRAVLPASLLGGLLTTGRLRPPAEARAAWEAHAASDRFPKIAEVRRVAATVLPGARVRRRFFWRY